MTGIEVAAVVIAAGVGAVGHSRRERGINEEREVVALYRKHFNANFLEVSPDRPSVLADTLPSGLDAYAATCIRMIEVYQTNRKANFMGMSRTTDYVGDMRTRILEDMKKWLLTLSGESLQDVGTISLRLEYCRQLLLRPTLFEGSNENSFKKTLAQVCKQLESLLQQAASGQRSAEGKLSKLLNLGREMCEVTIQGLVYAVTASAPSSPQQWLTLLRSAEKSESSTTTVAGAVDWASDVGQLLRALLTAPAVRELLATEAASDAPSGAKGLQEELTAVRERWLSTGALGPDTGLLAAFRHEDQVATRRSYLELMENLERLAFFLRVLKPYHVIASTAGDLGLCRLYRSLRHLLQELENALLLTRQSRIDLMRGVKLQLRHAAKLSRCGKAEERWIASLRHIDEQRFDQLHKEMAIASAEVLKAASFASAAQLQVQARQGLQDIAEAFNSVEFQARARMALPDGLLMELRKGLTAPADQPMPLEQ
mmetsp:Transcript_90/g.243  ORF Transcript_90/g.243 Transcript_90/m.243 type:complete len:485 (+) Transcript_90:86-1540(+)